MSGVIALKSKFFHVNAMQDGNFERVLNDFMARRYVHHIVPCAMGLIIFYTGD